MHGHDQLTAAFVVQGEKTALVETGPKSRLETVLEGLDAAGLEELDWIVLTHIHLDHAGAAGSLAARFPRASVAVHGIGAPHLVDPSKLWSSAARIYGDKMDELWGGIDPLTQDRILVLDDGDKVDLGGRSLQAIETPGHAFHHHAFLDDATGIVFSGDALGVRLPGTTSVRPTTPPPEFDLEKAVASIERLRSVGASAFWLTHFGPAQAEPDEVCDEAIEALREWAGWVRVARKHTSDLDEAAALVRQQARDARERELPEGALEKMEDASSYWMNTWGYMRYFDKHDPSA